jgi:hypothetical protein
MSFSTSEEIKLSILDFEIVFQIIGHVLTVNNRRQYLKIDNNCDDYLNGLNPECLDSHS